MYTNRGGPPWRGGAAILVVLATTCAALPPIASGQHATPEATMTSDCSKELTTEVLAQLWRRGSTPMPAPRDPFVTIKYRDGYGQPADALLFALDGVTLMLNCNVSARSAGDLFAGRLSPGIHHLDAVFNFGIGKGGRGGRAPLTFKVKPGRTLSLTVVIDRNDHEWPIAFVESVPLNPLNKKAK